MLRSRLLRYSIPFVFYGALILFVSSRSGDQLPSYPLPDKILHFLEYFLFGALLFRVLREWGLGPAKRLWGSCLIGLILFAFLDETIQSVTAGRDADWRDGFADVIGGWTGALVYYGIKRIFDRR